MVFHFGMPSNEFHVKLLESLSIIFDTRSDCIFNSISCWVRRFSLLSNHTFHGIKCSRCYSKLKTTNQGHLSLIRFIHSKLAFETMPSLGEAQQHSDKNWNRTKHFQRNIPVSFAIKSKSRRIDLIGNLLHLISFKWNFQLEFLDLKPSLHRTSRAVHKPAWKSTIIKSNWNYCNRIWQWISLQIFNLNFKLVQFLLFYY